MNLGKNILHECREKGWSLATLAKKSSVPKATLHGWVTGRTVRDMVQLKRVAIELRTPLYRLLFGLCDPTCECGRDKSAAGTAGR